MARAREPWNIRPARKSPSVPSLLKAEVEAQANDLIVNVLKPKYVKPPSTGEQFNYITDIATSGFGTTSTSLRPTPVQVRMPCRHRLSGSLHEWSRSVMAHSPSTP
jgi:hypothetical protein